MVAAEHVGHPLDAIASANPTPDRRYVRGGR